ncbi:MAG TPA: acyltransferase [Bacteroidales bacterium]|nr:acyltransferase [Bacteroidales bacterium]HPJ59189.1 acyltransferase [Bacteroidales bacterium]HPR11812.1 acyltransferase [Bacteroidales bacterium]HRW84039.1 acyltransferase [Bacteroidales bacterium]
MKAHITEKIFRIIDEDSFQACMIDVFRLQSAGNPVYREFIRNLGVRPEDVTQYEQIPFLPAELFRNNRIITGTSDPEIVFESSGTTGSAVSRHYVTDVSLYERSLLQAFTLFYGDPSEYLIAALLPSYTEREHSSLVYMVKNLTGRSMAPGSGFYRDNPESLIEIIISARDRGQKVILIGVSFALLDIAEKFSPDLHDIIIMETGGMKGRRKEITRHELHSVLTRAFNVEVIHSEYGMTELLSQAYSKGEGIFWSPPWMKIVIRDPLDPLSLIKERGVTGAINIIDLANINSCSFLATGDLGKVHKDGSFEVQGRIDNSDIRGCNLMME